MTDRDYRIHDKSPQLHCYSVRLLRKQSIPLGDRAVAAFVSSLQVFEPAQVRGRQHMAGVRASQLLYRLVDLVSNIAACRTDVEQPLVHFALGPLKRTKKGQLLISSET